MQGSDTVTKRRLGRGLNALLGNGDSQQNSESTEIENSQNVPDQNEIDVQLIQRNPFQPRVDFEEESISELVSSLKQHGVLQPLLVRSHEDAYQLIAGERRLIAAKRAGLQSVPCRVLELEDRQVCEVAIEENLKRKDLNVLEKAQAFKKYIEEFSSSAEELAKQLSLNRSTISNILRLLELSPAVQTALRTEKISNGHARALLSLEEADQIALCKRIEEESLSVRKVEQEVRVLLNRDRTTIPFPQANTSEKSPSEKTDQEPETEQPGMTNHIKSLCDQLEIYLGTPVCIKLNSKDTGKIIIDFKSNSEFERIVNYLRDAA